MTVGSRLPSRLLLWGCNDCGGVYLVPAFAGLGAPYWDMHARGSIVGLTAGSGRNHIIRASLESIAYQTEDVLCAMRDDMAAVSDESDITSLRVDGGASANSLLMQMQSDFSGIDVLRSENAEATAMGAAYLAGLAVGFFKDREELRSKAGNCIVYKPQMDVENRKSHLDGWHRAVKACRAFSQED